MENNAQRAVGFLTLASSGHVDEAYELVAPGGRHHNPYFQAGWDALREGMREAAMKAPHQEFEVQHVVAEGDMVAVHSHVVPDAGGAGLAVVHLFRFDHGLIAELWDVGMPVPEESPNVDGMF